jgi:hypothetical protein
MIGWPTGHPALKLQEDVMDFNVKPEFVDKNLKALRMSDCGVWR